MFYNINPQECGFFCVGGGTFNHVTDSIGHSPITVEIMEFYHYRGVVYYNISSEAIKNIAEHGITKMRRGKDGHYTDAVYHHNEFGKMLTEAYKDILRRLSPDYMPPKSSFHL